MRTRAPKPRTAALVTPLITALTVVLASTGAAAPPAAPQSAALPATTEAPLATLETVVVTGVQPGPGLWQIRKGDHTLWIMATLSPLPRRMEWEPRELDALVAGADRVLTAPGVDVDADIGFFGGLRLLPTALRARNNPDDKSLAEVLPPALYARWEAQKAKYMGRDRGVEERRPVFAAYTLMEEALEDLDLKRDNIVWDRVERIAKRNDREIVEVNISIKIDDPREALREFERSSVDDIGCMDATLRRLETDTPNMIERANAWAVGDLQTLEELRVESEIRACALALLGTDALKKRGFDDLPRRVVNEWVRVAEESLAGHATTVAVADYQVLTNEDGLLPAMRAKGYEIIAPGEDAGEALGAPSQE
ncbi:MAG: TraB/GumN family protein [Silanimonas sp.]